MFHDIGSLYIFGKSMHVISEDNTLKVMIKVMRILILYPTLTHIVFSPYYFSGTKIVFMLIEKNIGIRVRTTCFYFS